MVNFKKNNAITLVSLVITIVIMLILAGVSISFIMGNNGLFSKTNSTKVTYQKRADLEKLELDAHAAFVEGQNKDLDTIDEVTLKEEITKSFGEENVAWTISGDSVNGWQVIIIATNTSYDITTYGKVTIGDSWKEISREEATCTKDGKVVYQSLETGEQRIETISKLGHIDTDNNSVCDRCGIALRNVTVGDMVSYEPEKEATAKTYTLKKEETGCTADQIMTQENLSWQIYSINDDGTVDLISTQMTGAASTTGGFKNNFELTSPTGINNAERLLNEACNELYSNEAIGAVARSMNLNDINKKASNAQTGDFKYYTILCNNNTDYYMINIGSAYFLATKCNSNGVRVISSNRCSYQTSSGSTDKIGTGTGVRPIVNVLKNKLIWNGTSWEL